MPHVEGHEKVRFPGLFSGASGERRGQQAHCARRIGKMGAALLSPTQGLWGIWWTICLTCLDKTRRGPHICNIRAKTTQGKVPEGFIV